MSVKQLVAGLGLIVLSAAFVRLAVSDRTETMYLIALEYAFSLALLVAGLGLMALSLPALVG
jgi:hypothetical protein